MTAQAALTASGQALLAPEGRLDALTAPTLERDLRQALTTARGDIVVDMGRVSYISSSGLRVLLVAARLVRQKGRTLRLCCLSPRVAEVFALAGFDMVFPLHSSREEACRAGHLGLPPA
ncbi:MAG: STAS domain-containing protein [Anaerolineae bacterium]